jgi:CheY-like chemotaxis protein
VKIYSEVGHGTTVKIYLPRLMADAQAEEEVRDEVPEAAPGEENILVVEDDDDVRIYTVESLRELGYRVLEAHDGASALRLLERQETPVSLLLTDVVMPGMSGRELADEALAMYPDLKVLFTTGYARNAIVHGGRLDPGVELLPKPFTFEALAAKVRDVLEMNASERILVLAADDGIRGRFAATIDEVGLAADEAATRVEALGRLKAMAGRYAAVLIQCDEECEASIAALRAERQDLPIVIETADDPEALRRAHAGDRCIGIVRAPANSEELRLCLRDLRVRCEGGGG